MVKETPTIELFDFNAKFAETKAHAKVTIAFQVKFFPRYSSRFSTNCEAN